MKINAKKIIGVMGLMAAGGVLTLAELARELLSEKSGQWNRDTLRGICDAIESDEPWKIEFSTGKPSE